MRVLVRLAPQKMLDMLQEGGSEWRGSHGERVPIQASGLQYSRLAADDDDDDGDGNHAHRVALHVCLWKSGTALQGRG